MSGIAIMASSGLAFDESLEVPGKRIFHPATAIFHFATGAN
jgi:hypothetical protein